MTCMGRRRMMREARTAGSSRCRAAGRWLKAASPGSAVFQMMTGPEREHGRQRSTPWRTGLLSAGRFKED